MPVTARLSLVRSVRKVRWPGKRDCGCYLTGGREAVCADEHIRCLECAVNMARLMTEPPRPGRGGQDQDDDPGQANGPHKAGRSPRQEG